MFVTLCFLYFITIAFEFNPTSSFPTQKQPKTTIIQKQESLFYWLSPSAMPNVVPELYA